MSYREHFDEAMRFTRKLGFGVPELLTQTGELVSPENGELVMRYAKKAGISDLSASALQCLKWSYALQPCVEAGLGCSVALTIGQITHPNLAIFNPTQNDFERWAKMGINVADFETRSGFNFHVWYTLPTMEILDMTLWSTLAVAWEKPELKGQVIGGWPDLIAPSPSFIPMVIGREYVEHVHSISEVPLLSSDNSQEGLAQIPVMLIQGRKRS